MLRCNVLHITCFVRLLQSSERITQRTELLADIAIVIGGGDGSADSRIVEFLVLVEFVASGIACGMEVAYVRDVVPQSTNYVSFPFLHAYKVPDWNFYD
jgi:hypothetical protein